MKALLIAAVAGLVAVPLLVDGVASAEQASGGKRATQATLRDTSGQVVGRVKLVQHKDKVSIRAEVRELEPGFHGFHIHETGRCTPTFAEAGGHFNPGDVAHGDHAGDLPSLLAGEDGTAFLWFETDRFAVADLFDEDGSAFIVHEGRDNYANIPDRYHSHAEDVLGPDSDTLATGDAGGRAACGVVRSRS